MLQGINQPVFFLRRKGVKKILTNMILFVPTALLLLPGIAPASDGSASPLVFVADSRHLSGWEAWFANLYNESRFLFTLLSVLLIPVIGLLFGLIAELIMSRSGLDLETMECKAQNTCED
jgi:hypothetical protein